jgi:predicted phosphodiesterase
MTKIGVFSDLHGDKQSLELIVRTMRQEDVSSVSFLGDAIYDTMSPYTNSELNKAHKFIEQMKYASPLRKDVMEGNFSDEQLANYLNAHEQGTSIGKKIAKAEYLDIKQSLSGFDITILGGNWDYSEEISEVFGNDYLNAQSKNICGLNFVGFSGGGSPHPKTAMGQTLSDDPKNQGRQAEKWAQKLLTNQELDADVFISHVPFSDGEGVEKEQAVENLKSFVMKRKEAGLDLPSTYMWGHRHGSGEVIYDSELEGFVVKPGCSSRNHNNNLPTFMIAEFDDDNKLSGAVKYTIHSSLSGFGEVREDGKYSVDHNTKKVSFTETNSVVLKDNNLPEFNNNLSLDKTVSKTHAKINVNYDLFKEDPTQLDSLIRNNILVMSKEVEDTQKQIIDIVYNASQNYVGLSEENKALEQVEDELFKYACEKMGADYKAIMDGQYSNHIRRSLLSLVLGIEKSDLIKIKEKGLKSTEVAFSWASEVAKESEQKLSRKYQQHIFSDLKSNDFQSMAEKYIPDCFERKSDLNEQDAWNLWVKSYSEGLIDSGFVEGTGAYRQKASYEKNKRSKEDIANFFGYASSDDSLEQHTEETQPLRDNQQSPRANQPARQPAGNQAGANRIEANSLPADLRERVRDSINNGQLPVLKSDEGEYVILPDNGQVYLNNEFREELGDYTTSTIEEQIGDRIKDGQISVIENEGQEYAVIGNQSVPISRERFGLSPNDYTPMSEQDYNQRILPNAA